MIKNLLGDDEPEPSSESKPKRATSGSGTLSLFDVPDLDPDTPPENFVISPSEPESMEETVRQSGLAYSAAIAFFAAVVFMLVLGWGADLLLGTSPWGIVGGIILGSVIGFIQFFRINSQIFKK